MPSKKIITKLTDEQEALIREYREKWRSVQNSVEIINYDKIIEVISSAYLNTGYQEPKILFYDNPLVAIQEVTGIEVANELRKINNATHGFYLANILDKKYYYCGTEWEDVERTLREELGSRRPLTPGSVRDCYKSYKYVEVFS